MVAMVFFASNFKDAFCIFDEDCQSLILDVAQGAATKKQIAKFFRDSRIKK